MRIGQHYYTWCHRNAGCEGIVGFQTRAKSISISSQIEDIIKRYCSLYVLPRSLESITTKADELNSDEILQCPQIIHYYPISKELWGLTHSRLSANQKGRGGNFFAHTLVFHNKTLESMKSNPFELVHSDIIRFNAEDSCGKQLDEISELKSFSSVDYYQKMFTKCREVGIERLQHILSALLSYRQGQKKRPVILCTSMYQKIADNIEAVLVLLPPVYRQSVAFSTYEPDPYRLLGGDEKIDLVANTIIGTIPQAEGGRFQFREDEFQNSYYVFDFDSNRQSLIPSPSKYVSLVCNAVNKFDSDLIEQVQSMITEIGLSKDPTLWDVALPAVFLLSTGNKFKCPDKWTLAINALVEVSQVPETAVKAIKILWNKSYSILSQLELETSIKIIMGYKKLLEKAGELSGQFIQKEKDSLVTTFSGLMQNHCYVLAAKLLDLVDGRQNEIRKKIIVKGIVIAQSKEWPAIASVSNKNSDEAVEAFMSIFKEGLHSLSSDESDNKEAKGSEKIIKGEWDGLFLDEEKSVIIGNMLEKYILCSQSMGFFKRAWSELSTWLFAKGLQQVPADKLTKILGILKDALIKNREQEGKGRLGIWELEYSAPNDKNHRTEILKEIASACGQSQHALMMVKDILSKINIILSGRENDLIEFYAYLFTQVEVPIKDEVLKHYYNHINSKQKDTDRWEIRRSILLLPEGQNLLAAECAAMLFPWEPDLSRSRLGAWINEVIRNDDKFAYQVSREISRVFKMQENVSLGSNILLVCYNEFNESKFSYKKALDVLAESRIISMSLEEFKKNALIDVIGKMDASEWEQETKAFLQVANIYVLAKRLPHSSYPEISFLDENNEKLFDILSSLNDEHWQQVMKWIISGFCGLEVENQTVVRFLVNLILAQKKRDEVYSESSLGQLRNILDRSAVATDMIIDQMRIVFFHGYFKKDLSTHVCSLSLFILVAANILHQSNNPRLYNIARIIGCVLTEDSAITKRLLWQRMQTHKNLNGEQWGLWLQAFKKQVEREMRLQRHQKSLFRRILRYIFLRHNPSQCQSAKTTSSKKQIDQYSQSCQTKAKEPLNDKARVRKKNEGKRECR